MGQHPAGERAGTARIALPGNGQEFFQAQLSPFVRADAEAPPQQEVAKALGRTEGTMRVDLHRLRQRYRKILLDEIAATLEPGGDVETELRYLRTLFGWLASCQQSRPFTTPAVG